MGFEGVNERRESLEGKNNYGEDFVLENLSELDLIIKVKSVYQRINSLFRDIEVIGSMTDEDWKEKGRTYAERYWGKCTEEEVQKFRDTLLETDGHYIDSDLWSALWKYEEELRERFNKTVNFKIEFGLSIIEFVEFKN